MNVGSVNVRPEIRTRIIGMFVVSMIAALTYVALFAGGETAQAKSAELGVLDTTEVDCYSVDEASILGMGDGSSIEPHQLWTAKVLRRWKTCTREVYISSPNGSYWKCVKWRHHMTVRYTPKKHAHSNDF